MSNVENNGRFIYVEPNNMYSGMTNTSIPFPYEDYCMSVDLKVIIPRRNACGMPGETVADILHYSSGRGTLSFMNGTDGMLTTNYTDISMLNPEANTRECLGIENIKITYNSWFYPQVEIKFIDVRGGALFGPQELAYDRQVIKDEERRRHDDKYSNTFLEGGSFYKALFSFPYPLFKLKVKGFYGRTATFNLAVEDFRGEFNSTTGNFDIVVKFIGYMYGAFADTPFSFLAVAPYLSYGGTSTYWQNEPSFVYDDDINRHIYTYPELMVKLAQAHLETELSDSVLSGRKNKKTIEKRREDISGINKQVETFLSGFGTLYAGPNTTKPQVNKVNDKVIIVREDDKTYSLEEGSKTEKTVISVYQQYQDLKKAISSYNDEYSTSLNLELPETITKSLTLIWKPSERKFRTKSGAIQSDNDEKYPNLHLLLAQYRSYSEEKELYVYDFSLNGLTQTIKEDLDKISSDIQKNDANITTNRTLEASKVLGFRTTIGNSFKMAFAHMDAFTYAFYHCLVEIYQQIKNNDSSRKLSSLPGLNVNDSDLGEAWRKDTDLCLPPFPAFFVSSESDGLNGGGEENQGTSKKVYAWLGKYSENLEEVKFVKDLVDATLMYTKKEVEAELLAQQLNDMARKEAEYAINETRSEGVYVRLTPHDFAYKNTNPYLAITTSSENLVGSVYSIFAIRFFYWLISHNNELREQNKKGKATYTRDTSFIEMFAKYDAINFFNAGYEATEDLKKMYEESQPSGKFLEYITKYEAGKRVYDAQTGFSGRPMFTKDKGDIMHYTWHNGGYLLPVGVFNTQTVVASAPSKNLISLKKEDATTVYDGRYSFNVNNIDVSNDTKTASSELREPGIFNSEAAQKKYEEMYGLGSSRERLLKNTYFNGDIFSSGVTNTSWGAAEKNNEGIIRIDDGFDSGFIMGAMERSAEKQKLMVNLSNFSGDTDFSVVSPSVILLKKDERETNVSSFCNDLYNKQEDIFAKAYLFLMGIGYKTDVSPEKYKSFRLYLVLLILGAYYYRRFHGEEILKFTSGIKPWSKEQFPISKNDFVNKGNRWEKDNADSKKGGNGIQMSLFLPIASTSTAEEYVSYADVVNKKNGRNLGFSETEITDNNGFAQELINLFTKWVNTDFSVISRYLADENFYETVTEIKNSILNGKKIYLKDINESSLQTSLRKTLFGKCHIFDIQDINDDFRDEKGNIYVSTSDFGKAFNVFCDKLKELYADSNRSPKQNPDSTNQPQPENDPIKEAEIETLRSNEDMYLSTYMILKNLYDKWFCSMPYSRWQLSSNSNEFDSFRFIDSKYYNIKHVFPCDMNHVSDLASTYAMTTSSKHSNSANHSFYEFLSEIARKNEMVMLALPIGNAMRKGDDEFTKMKTEVEDLFTPFPYNKSVGDDDSNTYICIYPHKPSEHLDIEGASYADDSFNIANSKGLVSQVIPEVFAQNNSDTFLIPSFGVTFAKQNQSFFKNIKVSMANPQVTESSLMAKMAIASRGSEGPSQATVFGQDLYRVYVNNSYTCTVEMMGDLQIAPLMYFQLNNIPMFRGVYQIINVDHTVGPGTVSTTFTGVRVNRYNVPFATSVVGFTSEVWENGMAMGGVVDDYAGGKIIYSSGNRDFSQIIPPSNADSIPRYTWLSGNVIDNIKARQQLDVISGEIKYIIDELTEFEADKDYYNECKAQIKPQTIITGKTEQHNTVNPHSYETSTEVANNLVYLAGCLQVVRDAWATYCVKNNIKYQDLYITSGYRNAQSNASLAGASKTSSHMQGLAADIQIKDANRDNKILMLFFEFLVAFMEVHKNDHTQYLDSYDQILLERSNTGGQWVHFSPARKKDGNTVKRRDIYFIQSTPTPNVTFGTL